MQANLTVNILSIISLIYTIVYSHKSIKLDLEPLQNKINNVMSELIIFMIILESCTLLLPASSNIIFIGANHLIRFLIFILTPIFPMIGTIFLKSILKLSLNLKKLVSINLINITLCILNIKFGFLYTISNNNIYSRSSYFLVAICFSYIYAFYSFFLLFKDKNDLFKMRTYYFSFCIIILITFASIQVIFETIHIFWPISAAVLLINHIVIQQKTLYYNSTTLCKNAPAFINTLYDLIRNKNMFFVVFIKIENLNYISKIYGSKEENKCTIHCYKLCKKLFLHKGDLFHYKYDCFVGIIDSNIKLNINTFMTELANTFSNSYEYSSNKYIIRYNFTYDTFNPDSYSNAYDYLYYINNLIYDFSLE